MKHSYLHSDLGRGRFGGASHRKKQRSYRGGLLDLALVTIVVGSCWLRTPVGGLAERAWVALTESEREVPALTSYFMTAPPPEIVEIAEVLVETGVDEMAVPIGGFPEPWRSAALRAVPELPAAGRSRYAELLDPGETEPVLAVLDDVYAGDPEAALERLVVDEAQRQRAIRRARSAGDANPNRYGVHRRYLPAEIAREADEVISGAMALGTLLHLTWPVEGPHRISSPYGFRQHPVLKKRKFHNGVDLAVPIGTPILATQSGTAAVVAEDDVSGRYVVLDHGHGVRSSYCHLSEYTIEEGAAVEAGETIGLSGNTGRSTGPHLHFIVRVGGETVDPQNFRLQPDVDA